MAEGARGPSWFTWPSPDDSSYTPITVERSAAPRTTPTPAAPPRSADVIPFGQASRDLKLRKLGAPKVPKGPGPTLFSVGLPTVVDAVVASDMANLGLLLGRRSKELDVARLAAKWKLSGPPTRRRNPLTEPAKSSGPSTRARVRRIERPEVRGAVQNPVVSPTASTQPATWPKPIPRAAPEPRRAMMPAPASSPARSAAPAPSPRAAPSPGRKVASPLVLNLQQLLGPLFQPRLEPRQTPAGDPLTSPREQGVPSVGTLTLPSNFPQPQPQPQKCRCPKPKKRPGQGCRNPTLSTRRRNGRIYITKEERCPPSKSKHRLLPVGPTRTSFPARPSSIPGVGSFFPWA